MILCLDIGGSKIAAGLVKSGRVFHFQKTKWQKPLTAKKIINQIIQIISGLKSKTLNLKSIAIGVAGQVDKKGEVFITRHLLGKRTKIALKKILEKKFKLPIYVENDAHCFALAEAVLGQGKGKKFVIGLTLGSGIGGGIIINQKIFGGKDGFAGEIGHTAIEAQGEKCSCGKKGCFEAHVSATALKKFYYQLTRKKVSGFEIDKLFRKKDKKAILAANKVADYLAIGLGNIINIFNPEVIILGGGLSRFKKLMEIAVARTKLQTLIPNHQTKILISKLGDNAQLLGASLLVKK